MYRMCGRNVLQIGMYLSVELWGGSHFFIYIGNYIILFMFVLLLYYCLFVFLGWRPQLFTSFVLAFITFQSKANTSCSNTQKAHLQPSDVKSPNLSDAPMPKVMYIGWTTFKLLSLFRSVFVTKSVLALSERAAISNRRHGLIPSTKAVFYTDLRAVPFSMQ